MSNSSPYYNYNHVCKQHNCCNKSVNNGQIVLNDSMTHLKANYLNKKIVENIVLSPPLEDIITEIYRSEGRSGEPS